MSSEVNRRAFLGAVSAGGALLAAPGTTRQQPYSGVFIIMQTPFLDSLEIDEESLRREADFLVRCGVHGMVWPAGAGETQTLSYTERMKFASSVVQEVKGRTPVVIGVHGANKFEATEYARHAEKIGADAMLALSQTDGTTDVDVLTEYFTAITSASRLPLFIQVSSPVLTVDYLIGLAKKLPTFRYVKDEQPPVRQFPSASRDSWRRPRACSHL
jgi:4-hydroxy-tetrahydrodipicolinate synthase